MLSNRLMAANLRDADSVLKDAQDPAPHRLDSRPFVLPYRVDPVHSRSLEQVKLLDLV